MLRGTHNITVRCTSLISYHIRFLSQSLKSTNFCGFKSKKHSIYHKYSTMSTSYILALDQGTSSTRAILYDTKGQSLVSHQVPLTVYTPKPGYMEQDPMEILSTCKTCLEQVTVKAQEKGLNLSNENVKAIGITNQRETTIIWDRKTGKPLYNAIVWSDSRTQPIVFELENLFLNKDGLNHFKEKTGLPISTYFSATKYLWMVRNVSAIKSAVENGSAMFGTVDSWIIWNMTGGCSDGVHITDVTNASRTLLFNLKSLDWDDEILNEFNIPRSILPIVKSSAEVYGEISKHFMDNTKELLGVKIAGCLGDQQSALVGHRCFNVGDAKSTYGTGCFVLYNTGTQIVPSKHGLLSTVAYKFGNNSPVYALEGSVSTCASGLDWLRSTFEFGENFKDTVALAEKVPDTAGVLIVPAFNGLLAPRWRPDARAIILGLSFYTNKSHIVRAMLEAIALQAVDVLQAMKKDSEISGITSGTQPDLKVDGGLSNSQLLLQIQSDLLGSPVSRPADIESTARGAAFAAGYAVGLFDLNSNSMLDQQMTVFKPTLSEEDRKSKLDLWERAIHRSFEL